MDNPSDWLTTLLGNPGIVGAKSWMQAFYWSAGALLAVFAWMALKQRVYQARASFLLQLYGDWCRLEKIRDHMYRLREEISKEVFRDHSDYEDKHRMEQLRSRWKDHIDAVKKDDQEQYIQFLAYLCFFENVGLMVRRRYVPLKDILHMYKGPILDVGDMFTLHIHDWQKRANVPDGLFENTLYLVKRTQRRNRMRSRLMFWK